MSLSRRAWSPPLRPRCWRRALPARQPPPTIPGARLRPLAASGASFPPDCPPRFCFTRWRRSCCWAGHAATGRKRAPSCCRKFARGRRSAPHRPRQHAEPRKRHRAQPDLIVDVGSTAPRYAALAEKVQQQTGIPYALLDGGILSLSTTYEKLGRLIGREADGVDFADYCNMTLGVITNRIAFVPAEKRPRVYYARGPRGLTTGAGRLERCRDHRASGAQRRRRAQRRADQCHDRTSAAVGPGRDRHHRPGFRG